MNDYKLFYLKPHFISVKILRFNMKYIFHKIKEEPASRDNTVYAENLTTTQPNA